MRRFAGLVLVIRLFHAHRIGGLGAGPLRQINGFSGAFATPAGAAAPQSSAALYRRRANQIPSRNAKERLQRGLYGHLAESCGPAHRWYCKVGRVALPSVVPGVTLDR